MINGNSVLSVHIDKLQNIIKNDITENFSEEKITIVDFNSTTLDIFNVLNQYLNAMKKYHYHVPVELITFKAWLADMREFCLNYQFNPDEFELELEKIDKNFDNNKIMKEEKFNTAVHKVLTDLGYGKGIDIILQNL